MSWIAPTSTADRAANVPSKRVRIAVLNSHPIQYFAPLYAYLNTTSELDVTALYLSDLSIRGGRDAGFGREVKWDVDLLAGYHSKFLGAARKREPAGFWSLIAPEIWNEITSGRYDALWLHGHHYAANLIAIAAAKLARVPVMMRGETHLGLARHGLKAKVRRPLMASLYSQCDRLLAIGSANADFYRAMGVPPHKIFLVPYAVDNDRFVRAAELAENDRDKIRKSYNIAPGRPVILYAAKFTARKRPRDLLEATRLLRNQGSREFTVVMAGSGELEQELRAFCGEQGLNNVVFTGFINQSQLPGLYAASDVFVLPSEQEPWGLAVNEAMCAKLPIVVSREVGCVQDLVREGVNGFTPEAGDVAALSRALASLISSDDLRRQQGAASLARIRQWGYPECLEGIQAALAGLRTRSSAAIEALRTNGT